MSLIAHALTKSSSMSLSPCTHKVEHHVSILTKSSRKCLYSPSWAACVYTHQVEQHVSEVSPHPVCLRLVQVTLVDDVHEDTLVDVEVLWGKKWNQSNMWPSAGCEYFRCTVVLTSTAHSVGWMHLCIYKHIQYRVFSLHVDHYHSLCYAAIFVDGCLYTPWSTFVLFLLGISVVEKNV